MWSTVQVLMLVLVLVLVLVHLVERTRRYSPCELKVSFQSPCRPHAQNQGQWERSGSETPQSGHDRIVVCFAVGVYSDTVTGMAVWDRS